MSDPETSSFVAGQPGAAQEPSTKAPSGETPTTGRRRRRDLRPAPIWIPLVVGIFGLVAVLFGVNALQAAELLRDQGVTATGHVTDLRRELSTDENSSGYDYFIDYEFADAAGSLHRGSARTSAETYATRRKGDPVTVTYLPSEPTTFRVGTPDEQPTGPLVLIGLGSVIGAVGLAAFVITFVRRRRAPVLAVKGPDFKLVITQVEPGPTAGSFQRHRGTILDGTTFEGGGVVGVVANVAIEGIADAIQNLGEQEDVVAVDQAGLTIPEFGPLGWDGIAEIRASDSLLSVVPRDQARLASFAAPRKAAWQVGLVAHAFSFNVPADLPRALNLRLHEVEGGAEPLIDMLARHRIVDIES